MTLDNALPHADIENREHENSFNAKRVIQINSLGEFAKNQRLRENKMGSAGTGSDGDTNRIFTLTTTNAVDIIEVFLDGLLLIETSQYTIDNTLKQITISLNVFDTQIVSIFYNV